ncbi:MAG: hypothetical protein JRF24_06450 [Deltaproteobacteria bacterium]|nr:hypothetical protein [Deltaproteobacteria bacterium]
MFFLFRYNKDGIPQGLIKFHDLFVEDTIGYFEKGKSIRKRIKDARKALNKAIKIAHKKRRNPGVMLGTAQKALKGVHNEVAYIRKALKAIYDNMEKALKQIEAERIEEPLALLEEARGCFEKKNVEKGIALLKESREKAEKKQLLKTRTALFCGVSDGVKDLKREIGAARSSNHLRVVRPNTSQKDQPESEPDRSCVDNDRGVKLPTHLISEAIATIESESW